MLRGLVHVLAWSLATGAAVTLSWWGVHTVMAGTAYDPPRALPIAAAQGTRPEPSRDVSGRESATPSAPASSPSASPSPSKAGGGREASTTAAPAPSATPDVGRVKGYDTDGGRVVFDLGTSSATLVSATPGVGWSMQVWKTETWIRVEFASGVRRVSVFCVWHDSAPRVEVGNY
ncbi:hypothetical protein AB0C59_13485 [Streptomyces sp. NPDC048664]|uniref:hypothetical protein n=1 Tax=Streptomyces sp. NPDC048664 TaxID=3154505 RepID=UPI0034477132